MLNNRTCPGNAATPKPAAIPLIIQFEDALKKNDDEKLSTLLKEHPEILLQKDAEDNTLLHLAAKHCHNEALILLIINKLQQLNKCDEILKSINKEGKTSLLLATQCNNSDMVRLFLKILGEKANLVAKIADHKTMTPFIFSTIQQQKNPSEDIDKKICLLYKCSTFHTLKKLSEPVDFKIPVDLKIPQGSTRHRIQQNLKIAIDTINEVRKLLPHSSTHPELNNKTKEIEKNKKLINAFREKHNDDDSKNNDVWNNYIAELIQFKHGDCAEMAELALYKLRKNHPDVRSNMARIKGGDHVFVILDIAPDSDPDNSHTWGPHTIICDPWSGKAYPLSEVESELEDFQAASAFKPQVKYNLLVKFNPTYQELVMETYPPAQSFAVTPNNNAVPGQKRQMENQQLPTTQVTPEDHQNKRVKR